MQLLNMKIDLKMNLNNDDIIDMFLQNANNSDTLFYLSKMEQRSTDPTITAKFSSGIVVSTMLKYLKRHRSFTNPLANDSTHCTRTQQQPFSRT